MEEKAAETESRSKSNTHRIDKFEEKNTWLWHTVVGAIIVAAVTALAIIKKGSGTMIACIDAGHNSIGEITRPRETVIRNRNRTLL